MPEPAAFVATVAGWDVVGDEACAIRSTVFVGEQGVPAALEHDGRDPACVHVLVRDARGRAVATGRLLPDDRIGRMAVLREARGQGAGVVALRALIEAARARGSTLVRLNAQQSAVGFYLRQGFRPDGAPFIEAAIEHLPMSLRLDQRHDAR